MQITKERIEIEDILLKRINMILKMNNINSKLINGNVINISNTNLAYIEPHKLIIKDITYLFFNNSNNVYINNLENSIPFSDLEKYIKTH